MSQWKLLDFICTIHGNFEVLTDKRDGPPHPMPCPRLGIEITPGDREVLKKCNEPSPVATTNAVPGRVKQGEVSQGKRHTHDRPDWVMNTDNLADGQSPAEWKQEETKRITGRDIAADAAEMKERGASFDFGRSV